MWWRRISCCWDNAEVDILFSTFKLKLNFDDNRRV